MKKLFLLLWFGQVLLVSAQQNPDLEKPLVSPDSSRAGFLCADHKGQYHRRAQGLEYLYTAII